MPERLSTLAFSHLVSLYQNTLETSLRRCQRYSLRSERSPKFVRRRVRQAHEDYDIWCRWLLERHPVSMSLESAVLQLRWLPERVEEQIDVSQDIENSYLRSEGVSKETQKVIADINTRQFAYPNFNRIYGDESVIRDGWNMNYRWHTFKEMVTTDRGYEYWMWPMSVLYTLQQAELLHHTANPFMFNVIKQCKGKLKRINKNQLGRMEGHVTYIRCGQNIAQPYIHDSAIWRADSMTKVYTWYAKTGGWPVGTRRN